MITVSDIVEFDEILGKINRPKVNNFVCYESREISTVSLLYIILINFIVFNCKVSKGERIYSTFNMKIMLHSWTSNGYRAMLKSHVKLVV